MASPEPHPLEQITDPDQLRYIAEALAGMDLESVLDPTPRPRPAAMAQPDKLVPLVHDGGRLGRAMSPHLPGFARACACVRRWAPALAATTGTTTSLALIELPAPVTVYGVGLTGFAWWHCCGRPGPLAALQRLRDGLHTARAPSKPPHTGRNPVPPFPR